MGLITKIKDRLSFGGQPESDLTASDFEQDNNENSGDSNKNEDSNEGDEKEDGENGSGDGEQDDEGDEQEDGENGSGDGEQDDEGDEQEDGESGSGDGEQDDEGDEQEDGESGKSSSDANSTGNLSDQEREELKEQMDKDSSKQDMSDWYDTTSDYDKPTDFIQDHFDNLEEMRAEPESDMGVRKKERDGRIKSIGNLYSAQDVLEQYQKMFADDITKAFRKIKTREAPKAAEYGQRINVRNVIRKRAGDPTEERLYLEMDKSEVGDRCITVVVDSSGSMSEIEIKLALLALSEACEQIGDRFVATNYSTEKTTRNRDPGIQTHLITGPTEQFKPEHLDSFKAHGYTPTASGMYDGRVLADMSPNSEDVIIVITDGVANIDRDGTYHTDNVDSKPMNESEKQFNAAIAEGKRVIGVGVGNGVEDKHMQKIFGNSYVRTDMDKIADTLVEIYRSQMKTVKN